MTEWKPGDRVALMLPDNHGVRGPKRRWVAVEGTVGNLDDEGLPPGVQVLFDEPFNGADWCYASGSELKRA